MGRNFDMREFHIKIVNCPLCGETGDLVGSTNFSDTVFRKSWWRSWCSHPFPVIISYGYKRIEIEDHVVLVWGEVEV
jgi:hypothetical protein